MLDLQVSKRLGGFALEAGLNVGDSSVTVLVGESGSGKTTLLRLIAGLLDPDRGRIVADGETWFDANAGHRLPAAARAVGYVPQDYALFPHLTAADNVAFGLRASGTGRRETSRRTALALERLGIGGLGRRRPHELSGGQQQRVALARAIVLDPRVLLLDEPLSALDAQTRRAIRGELRRLLADLPCTTLYVTHSAAEALAFGETIAVLEAGRISQSGPRDDLMRHPRSPYVAEFLGVNFLRGSFSSRSDDAGAWLSLPERELRIDPNGDVAVVVHPREITLSRQRPQGTARNVFYGTIEELIPEPPAGERVRVSLATTPPLIAEVTRPAIDALELEPGLGVFASFKASGVVVVSSP